VVSSGGAGGGVAQSAALVDGVAEPVGFAAFEFDHAVEALGFGVGDPEQDGVDDRLAPAVDGAGEGEKFGDVVVGGAPGEQGVEGVADLFRGGLAAGDGLAKSDEVAEFLFGDPGQQDLLAASVALQTGDDLAELVGG
jgi:hypothetical protein